MTKRELEQLKHLYQERDSLAKKLAEKPNQMQQAFADLVKGSRYEIPYDVVTYKVRSEETYIRPETEKEKAEREKNEAAYDKAVAQIAVREAWIEDLEEPKIRNLLRHRYCEDLSWSDIALEMGYAVSTCKNFETDFWKVQTS